LYNDSIAKPLYDRGLLAEYTPGSPFKILTGLIALQEGVIDENTSFVCHHGFSYAAGRFMKCHDSGISVLHNGIYNSCNTYFASIYMKTINKYSSPPVGVDVWSNHLKSFGLGKFMGYDLPTGKKGSLPTSKTYKKMYPGWGWSSKTIVSNAIGQGEVLMTPIQLANMIATVANRGYYYTPHIIKKIKGNVIDKKFRTKHVTTINKKYFEPMIRGLFDVYNLGTANGLNVEGIDICGKTGTAENFAKINGKRVKLQDHSIFVAFAPKDNPKIAIAVFVENGYWGARWAGPITSLMIEKYIKKKITRTDLEKRMLEGSLQSEYNKYYANPIKDTFIKSKINDSVKPIDIKPAVNVKVAPEN
jgi:penicillin-binding protein 2